MAVWNDGLGQLLGLTLTSRCGEESMIYNFWDDELGYRVLWFVGINLVQKHLYTTSTLLPSISRECGSTLCRDDDIIELYVEGMTVPTFHYLIQN